MKDETYKDACDHTIFSANLQVNSGWRGFLLNEPCDEIWKTGLFVFSLLFLLSFQAFFHPGNTPDYRIVVMSLQSIVLVVGLICMDTLPLKITQKIMVLILLWLAWGWVCVWNSSFPVVSCLRQMEWSILVLFILLLATVLQKYPSLKIRIFWMVVGGFFLVCSDLAILWSVLSDPANYNWVTEMPHFTNIRNFGDYNAIVCVLLGSGSLQLAGSKLKKGYVLFLLSSIAWAILFWNGSRTGLLSAFIGMFCLTFFLEKRTEKKRYIIMISLTLIIGLGLSYLFPVSSGSMGWNSVLARNARDGLNSMSSGRIALWSFAIEFIETPKNLFFGIGPDVYRLKAMHSEWSTTVQPHNMLIQFVLEWGIPGAILLGGTLLTLLWHGWKNMVDKTSTLFSYQVAGYGAFICILLLGLMDGAMYHSLQLTMLGVCIAIMINLPRGVSSPTLKKNYPETDLIR